jgi:sugar lactone lactonase YvrE
MPTYRVPTYRAVRIVGWAVMVCAVMVCACAPPVRVLTECSEDAGLKPICSFKNPEDLATLPGGQWLLVSEFPGLWKEAPGRLSAYRPQDGRIVPLYGPAVPIAPRPERLVGTADCLEPPDRGRFAPHGLDVASVGGVTRLVVVNHGGREAIEEFDVRMAPGGPALTWVGCVPLPDDAMGNDVVIRADGSLVVTNFLPRHPGLGTLLRMAFARPTGDVIEWSSTAGWQTIAGTRDRQPNGLAASADGEHLFVTMWGANKLVRMRRDGSERREVALPHHPDNLSWTRDGQLLVTGQKGSPYQLIACDGLQAGVCGIAFSVVRVDPTSLATEVVLDHDPAHVAGSGSVAVEVGDDVWIGSCSSDRIVRYRPAPTGPPPRTQKPRRSSA